MEKLKEVRDGFNGWIYRNVLKRIFFQFDPEFVHKIFIRFGIILESNKVTKRMINDMFYYENPMLKQKILGIEFKNPVGLSAGFDKNGQIISICEDVGFGFSEIGSITKNQCDGNGGKRLDRIPEKRSLWVYFGLNNDGVEEIIRRLKKRKFSIPFGVSIAKTNCRETADDEIGKEDYIYSLKRLNEENVGNFYVLNISCPNSFGGQPFARPQAYESLLKDVNKAKVRKPIFVKMSPDLNKNEVDAILKISKRYKVNGFIISNLTKKHDRNKGGISGKAVEEASNRMIKYVYEKTKGKYIVIGVGGVFSAEDAYKKIKLGANMVQLITGMIYNGPNVISEINRGLVRLMKKDGYKNISEAVGKHINVKQVSA